MYAFREGSCTGTNAGHRLHHNSVDRPNFNKLSRYKEHKEITIDLYVAAKPFIDKNIFW